MHPAFRYWVFGVAGAVFGIVITGIVIVRVPKTVFPTGGQQPVPSKPIQSAEPTADIVNQAFSAYETWNIDPAARLFTLPHHVVAAKGIASLVSSIPKAPSTVFLIAPDHFSQGKTAFTTTDQPFTTNQGEIGTDAAAARRIVQAVPKTTNSPAAFTREHGIGAVLPFIKKAWPKATIVPIIVRVDATRDETDSLAAALEHELAGDPNAILIASLDFSHYQPDFVADFHDTFAEDVLRSVDAAAAWDVEIDSPPALTTLLTVARQMKMEKTDVLSHTNSLRILDAHYSFSSTSHIIASFAPGDAAPHAVTTTLVVGDAPRITSEEERFYIGQNAIATSTDMLPKPWNSLVGKNLIIGMEQTSATTTLRFFPIADGVLLVGKERDAALERLASHADPLHRGQVTRGVLYLQHQ